MSISVIGVGKSNDSGQAALGFIMMETNIDSFVVGVSSVANRILRTYMN